MNGWAKHVPLMALLVAVFGAGGLALQVHVQARRIDDMDLRLSTTERWCAVHQQFTDDAMREIRKRQDRDDTERQARPPKWSP